MNSAQNSASSSSLEPKSSSSLSFPRPSDSGTGFPHTYSLLCLWKAGCDPVSIPHHPCFLTVFFNWIVSTGLLSSPVHACLSSLCNIRYMQRSPHYCEEEQWVYVWSQSNLQCIIWLMCVCVCVCVRMRAPMCACLHAYVCLYEQDKDCLPKY